MSEHDPAAKKDRLVFASPHYAQTAATVLELTIKPEWESSVVTNLGLLEAAAAQVLDFDLPDDLEQAVVFIMP